MKTFIVLALSTFSIFAETTTMMLPHHSKDIIVNNMDGRIINGYLNKPGEIPYIVSLENSSYGHICGGSIIDHEWILTAAHCLENQTNLSISYGTINWKIPRIQYVIDKENFFVHKDFSKIRYINDIALIRTPYVEFNDSINKIILPNRTNDNYANHWARASGWGRIRTNSQYPYNSNLLQSMDVHVVSNYNCTRQFPFQLQDTHLCTSIFESKSVGPGDSGGPLVLNANETSNETPILIGLTAFTIGAHFSPGYPNIFTRVSKFLDWIENTMESVNSKKV